jgi:hypothetical protein
MKYLMLLTSRAEDIASWEGLSDEEARRLRESQMPAWAELFRWIEQRRLEVEGLELTEPKQAKLVQVRDGETIVTDGPYAETKEQVGGVFVVDLPSLDEAIDFASRIPVVKKASVEIRPLVER